MAKGVTLIGMSGSGKSTIGKQLARELNYRFVDLDALIAEKEGRSHAEILKEDGVEKLASLEEKHTLETDFSKTVFSPPGGIIYVPHAMQRICENSFVIFLDVGVTALQNRLKGKMMMRGIVGLNDEEGFEALFQSRLPLYRKYAVHTLSITDETEEEIVRKIRVLLTR